MCLVLYVNIYTHTYVYTHIYIFIHTHIYIQTCTQIPDEVLVMNSPNAELKANEDTFHNVTEFMHVQVGSGAYVCACVCV
jgi:pantothenate kinase